VPRNWATNLSNAITASQDGISGQWWKCFQRVLMLSIWHKSGVCYPTPTLWKSWYIMKPNEMLVCIDCALSHPIRLTRLYTHFSFSAPRGAPRNSPNTLSSMSMSLNATPVALRAWPR
jgi:hypothetical protein